jgi:GntR family transcriptional regulator / MocR family aminotransferase
MRREALLEAIGSHLGERVQVQGDGAGAHVVLWPKLRVNEEAVIAAAEERGVRVYGIGGYYLKDPKRTGCVLGYSRMSEGQIREGIRRLGEII